uniref:Mal d 1-associated protein n=1 Tax=Fagus sylvatica TaxID=28930 RepID=A0A2N9H6Q7_FAGSY
MGWVWKEKDDEPDQINSSASDVSDFPNPKASRSGDRCSTRKVVKSQCRTEEVEPGKFIRKCEKTEEVLRNCVGKPVEVVQSNKEYTEDDVTDEVLKGSVSFGSSELTALDFPGLRSDIEAIERSFFGGLNNFFEAAEEMKNGFFNAFGAPHLFDGESSSSPSMRRAIPIEHHHKEEAFPKSIEPNTGNVDLSGLAKDV